MKKKKKMKKMVKKNAVVLPIRSVGLRHLLFVLVLLFIAVIILMPTASAQCSSNYTTGSITLAVRDTSTGGTQDYFDSVHCSDNLQEMSIELSETAPNSGNHAEGRVAASLATGKLQVLEYAETNSDVNAGTAVSGSVRLKDALTITVPAGYYASGVNATLRGRIEGYLSASPGWSYARGNFIVYFGSDVLRVDFLEDNMFVDTPFALTHTLVSPGVTLKGERTYLIERVCADLNLWMDASVPLPSYASANFYNTAQFLSLDVPDGVTWTSASGIFMSEVSSPEIATIESSDISGTKTDIFQPGESVYAIGSGYAASTTYDLYVVSDTTWTDGMAIPTRVSGTETSVATDASGNITAETLIWSSSVQGQYDIVVDVNGNGNYDEGTDALDDMDVSDAGFEAIPEFSTIAIPVAAILGLLFLFNYRKRKREQ